MSVIDAGGGREVSLEVGEARGKEEASGGKSGCPDGREGRGSIRRRAIRRSRKSLAIVYMLAWGSTRTPSLLFAPSAKKASLEATPNGARKPADAPLKPQ